jgi:hypothetical protein
MKILRFMTLIALALALFVSIGDLVTAATDTNTFPGGSIYIDGQPHGIGAKAELWYRFDYAGDNSAVTVTMLNGAARDMGFKVYTPAQVGAWWETDPIGQGTPNGDDLTWVGNFNAAGTYYVYVGNDKPYGDKFQLTIAGDGVMLGAKTASVTAKEQPGVIVPAPGANIDSYHAAAVDGQAHTIPASASLWYRFDYGAGDRPVVTLTLVNGTNSGVGFKVYTTEQAATWWDTEPVGRGTASLEPCEGGMCLSNDLTWAGTFNLSGSYYVEVVNDNIYPMSFTLTMN